MTTTAKLSEQETKELIKKKCTIKENQGEEHDECS
jgi:hypothetical protein